MQKKADMPVLVTQLDPLSAIAEAYRTLRTNIRLSLDNRKHHLLMITSAIPDESKTIISVNLAIVMAQAGERVLLIDCDLRKPRVHCILHLDNNKGLTDYLKHNYNLTEIAQQGPVDNLMILTSGPIPPNPAELLGLEQMNKLWSQLLEKFDYVILDSPPVLAVADSIDLSTKVEGVIISVRAGVDQQHTVNDARNKLLRAKANVLGIVLNEVKMNTFGYRYYQYGEVENDKTIV